MTVMIKLPPHIGAALEAVTDADRFWFEAHPHRAYRLRPVALGELLPGQTVRPGSYIVVMRMGSPLVRMRLSVGRPPAHLRRDTDRTCIALVERLVPPRHRPRLRACLSHTTAATGAQP